MQTLGVEVARRLLLACEELDAEEMLRVGFLSRLVAPEKLEGATTALVANLVGLAPLAVQAMKRILADIAAGSVDEERTRALIERCALSDDLRAGLRAQRDGDTPDFAGG